VAAGAPVRGALLGHHLAAGNRPLQALAELRRRPELACDEAAAEASDPADDPEAIFAIKHRGEIVRDCLSRLSRRHREVIDLVYYHEKSVQEAAAILGVPGNTVKTRMFHARKSLSELLAARGVVGALA
jgi:RNA polymerase sigma-70 factor (ECF subfamily)